MEKKYDHMIPVRDDTISAEPSKEHNTGQSMSMLDEIAEQAAP